MKIFRVFGGICIAGALVTIFGVLNNSTVYASIGMILSLVGVNISLFNIANIAILLLGGIYAFLMCSSGFIMGIAPAVITVTVFTAWSLLTVKKGVIGSENLIVQKYIKDKDNSNFEDYGADRYKEKPNNVHFEKQDTKNDKEYDKLSTEENLFGTLYKESFINEFWANFEKKRSSIAKIYWEGVNEDVDSTYSFNDIISGYLALDVEEDWVIDAVNDERTAVVVKKSHISPIYMDKGETLGSNTIEWEEIEVQRIWYSRKKGLPRVSTAEELRQYVDSKNGDYTFDLKLVTSPGYYDYESAYAMTVFMKTIFKEVVNDKSRLCDYVNNYDDYVFFSEEAPLPNNDNEVMMDEADWRPRHKNDEGGNILVTRMYYDDTNYDEIEWGYETSVVSPQICLLKTKKNRSQDIWPYEI